MKNHKFAYGAIALSISSLTFAGEKTVELKTGAPADKYGAVAHYCEHEEYNLPPSESCGIGYSNNHVSQEEANQHAIEECGVSGCKVVAELTD